MKKIKRPKHCFLCKREVKQSKGHWLCHRLVCKRCTCWKTKGGKKDYAGIQRKIAEKEKTIKKYGKKGRPKKVR
jgi:hypothetical protein